MRKKKILKILAPLMVASVLFVGCGSKGESKNDDKDTVTASDSQTDSKSTDEKSNDSKEDTSKDTNNSTEATVSGKYGEQGQKLIEGQYSGDSILDFRKNAAKDYYSKIDSMVALMKDDVTNVLTKEQKIIPYENCGNSISIQGIKDYQGMNKDDNFQGIIAELRFEDDDKYKDVLERITLQFNVGQDDSINIDDNTKKMIGYITNEVSVDEIVSKLQEATKELSTSSQSSIKGIEIVNKKNLKLTIAGNKSDKKGRMIMLKLEQTTDYPQ